METLPKFWPATHLIANNLSNKRKKAPLLPKKVML